MSKVLNSLLIIVMFASLAFGGQSSYQVTGPVTAINGNIITIQKGKEKWDLDAGALVLKSGVKVGDKVTMQYTMTATTVSVKKK